MEFGAKPFTETFFDFLLVCNWHIIVHFDEK